MDDNEDLYIEESMIQNINEYKSIKDEIICEICHSILIKPKQCNTCESLFCERCINKWLLKNNSCPNRCEDFSITECPKLMKKILAKLTIQCIFCKDNFNYETYIYKHFEKCLEEKKMVKCPLCPDCQIKYKILEDFTKKFTKERKELLKEIKMYKEQIKELESMIEDKLRWVRNQKDPDNYELSNHDKTIRIEFISCNQLYLLENEFLNNSIYSFGLHIDTFGKLYDYLAIGFINEKFEYTCFCTKPKNAFYIRIDEEKIYYNDKKIDIKLENRTDFCLRFDLDLEKKKLDIKDYDTDESYGIVDVKGIKFKFFVSKCNSGIIEFTVLP